MQHFASVFSSELARHVNNPWGLGLDDLSLAWGKYAAAVGVWRMGHHRSPWCLDQC